MKKIELSNWTKFPKYDLNFFEPAYQNELINKVKNSKEIIPRGNGRCYGDASLGENVLSMLSLKHILSFDNSTGVIHVESGVLLSDILEFCVPKGWFLPVTPGTRFITVGGAIASNVHGKNHHNDGSFSKFVDSIDLITDDGQVKMLTPNDELFEATFGSMGLTGVILTVMIRLKKVNNSYVSVNNIRAKNLKEVFELFEKHRSYTYSVAWIDCYQKGNDLGRSILMLGEHASQDEVKHIKEAKKRTVSDVPKLKIPFNFPNWVLNTLTVRLFNFLYYYKELLLSGKKIIHYDKFFYPLDAILDWNRMYGKRGFIQYQFVLPMETSEEGLTVILEKIRKSGFGSFLAVLKLFGKKDNEYSFPMEGYTLALDFPIEKGLFEFLDDIDQDVKNYGGRIYLSKDARMSKETYKTTYKESSQKIYDTINQFDPKGKFVSLLSKRLGIR